MLKVYFADIASLRDEVHFAQSMRLVLPERREKIIRLKAKEEQLRSLAANRLLRIALEEAGIDYERQVFTYNEHGKPCLLHQSMHFNISHAGNYAVCGISDQPIGVDVEVITKLDGKPDQVRRIADRILTEPEQNFWNDEQGASGAELLKVWTKKESYAKMKGIGLSIGLETIDTIEGADFCSLLLDETHYVTVCEECACDEAEFLDRSEAI